MLLPFLSASTYLASEACCSASPGCNIFLRAGKYGCLMMPLLQKKIAFRRCITWPQAHRWVTNLVRKGTVNPPQLLEVLQYRLVLQSFACCPLTRACWVYYSFLDNVRWRSEIFFLNFFFMTCFMKAWDFLSRRQNSFCNLTEAVRHRLFTFAGFPVANSQQEPRRVICGE